MRFAAFALFGAFALMNVPTDATASELLTEALVCDNGVCSPEPELFLGGHVEVFENLAREIKETRRNIVIDRPCYSACVFMADLARPYVCITPNASFHIHQALTFYDFDGELPDLSGKALMDWFASRDIDAFAWNLPYSEDIQSWISGFEVPLPGRVFLAMDFRVAERFWPVCDNILAKEPELASEPNVATIETPIDGEPEQLPTPEVTVVPTVPGGSWDIQVGFVSTRERAEEIIERARRSMGSAGASLQSFIHPVEKNGRTWYRARFIGIKDRRGAADLCRLVRSQDISIVNWFNCLPIRG